MGNIVDVAEHTYQFAIALEHWLPQQGDSNPILDRSRAFSEAQVQIRAGQYLKRYIDNASSFEFIDQVGDMGATMEDGTFMVSPKTRADIRVSLHDHRRNSRFHCVPFTT